MSKNKQNKKKSTTPASKITFIVLGVIYAIAVICLIIYFNSAKSPDYLLNNNSYTYDYENFFGDDEVKSINETCSKIAKKNKLAIFVSTTKRNYSWAEINGDQFRKLNNLSQDETFVVIILNKSTDSNATYHFDIYTYGKAYSRITENEIDAILYSSAGDNILSSNQTEVLDGIKGVAEKCGTAFSFVLPKSSWLVPCIIALILSILIAFFVNKGIKKSYSRKRANQTYSLSSNSKLNLKEQSDIYVTSTITSVVIRDDNHSRSSGGGFSSGGGSGGGHRGGR